MKALAVVCPPSISSSIYSSWQQQDLGFRFGSRPKSQLRNSGFRILSSLITEGETESESKSYKGGVVVDESSLNVFRSRMVEEVGWDSDKPGYDGLIEVAKEPKKILILKK